MINTFHTNVPLPPPPVPPRMGMGLVPPTPPPRLEAGGSRALSWCLALVLGLHIALSTGGFIYLANSTSKVEHLDDIIVLKRLQHCDDISTDDQSLLDCKKLVDKFRRVMEKASQTEGRVSMLTGNRFHGALAHMSVSLKKSGGNCTAQHKEPCTLKWDLGHAELANVDTRGDSSLRIVHPGYYYVYSHITYSVKNAPSAPESIIRHVRLKKSEGQWAPPERRDEILLKSYCPSGVTSPCTSSQGGIYNLEKDEELYVEVTDLSWVNYDWNSTFFGLYKL